MSAKKGKWTERFNQKNDFDFTVSRVIVTVLLTLVLLN